VGILLPVFQGKKLKPFRVPNKQCFGSGSGLDPDSIRSEDPDGSRRAKMTHKNTKKLRIFSCFEVLHVLFLRAEGFSCSLEA
jgi:hypothetical protein